MPNDLTAAAIRALRKRLGLTQAQFAALLNDRVPGLKTHQVTVARWESGIPPAGVAAAAIRDLMAAHPA